jgi:hypothetical protein
VDWSGIRIVAPFKGTVWRVEEEWAGTQVQIRSAMHSSYVAIIFHVKLQKPLAVGDSIAAGQVLGSHIGSQTMSDIAIGMMAQNQWRLVSYFEVMSDSIFARYQSRGITRRSDAIISKAARDADTLRCNGETFLNSGTIENWITLH